MLKDLEVGIPWQVIVCPNKMQKLITEFLDKNVEATLGGDVRGLRYYEDWNEGFEKKKREMKEKFK